MAAFRQYPGVSGLHVRAPRQETAVHGNRVRTDGGMESRRAARVVAAPIPGALETADHGEGIERAIPARARPLWSRRFLHRFRMDRSAGRLALGDHLHPLP